MRLTAWEEERLLIFTAAELARRHRDAGLRLNHPEAVAIACDAMLEAARAGRSYLEVEAAGRGAVTVDQLLPGVAGLVDEVRLEVLFGDGPRLVVLVQPFGGGGDEAPGAVRSGHAPASDPTAGRERRRLTVRNNGRRIVRVSSHYPFERVNPRLAFDRAAAAGFRLDLPAGATERWAPGESKEIGLVRLGGDRSP
ncbi:MAG: urease subunit gamma [Chloroflexota bacterium]|nr:urease subunit gamma [Chloroflexota bacterium]